MHSKYTSSPSSMSLGFILEPSCRVTIGTSAKENIFLCTSLRKPIGSKHVYIVTYSIRAVGTYPQHVLFVFYVSFIMSFTMAMICLRKSFFFLRQTFNLKVEFNKYLGISVYFVYKVFEIS